MPTLTLREYAFLGLAAVLAIGAWYLHHEGYAEGERDVQALWDADKAARQVEFNKQLLAQAAKVTNSEIQHEKDLNTIASAVVAASSVKLHFPVCPKPVPTASKAGSGADGTSGVVQPTTDELFADFQGRIGKIIERCDKLNADTIELNGRL
jgi:hypothetical protein